MGFCLLICRLVLIWLDAGFRVPEAGVNALVCGIRFLGGWLRGLKCPRAGVGLLLGGPRT